MKFQGDPYVKDGVRHIPTDHTDVCGRCGKTQVLTIVHPVNDRETDGVWNDAGWFALFRRIGSADMPPPKFTLLSREAFGGVPTAGLLLCARCGDQFKEWLARAD